MVMIILFPICYLSQLKHFISYERDCLRKAREALLIHKAKTVGPLGIKKRNELYSLCNPYHVHLQLPFIILQ